MKPKNAFIAGMLILAGLGLLAAAISAFEIVSRFPSGNIAAPFRQHATNFFVFANFVILITLNLCLFVGGLSLVGFAITTALKNLRGLSTSRCRKSANGES